MDHPNQVSPTINDHRVSPWLIGGEFSANFLTSVDCCKRWPYNGSLTECQPSSSLTTDSKWSDFTPPQNHKSMPGKCRGFCGGHRQVARKILYQDHVRRAVVWMVSNYLSRAHSPRLYNRSTCGMALLFRMVALGGAFWVVPGISKIHLWLFQALLTPDRVHWVGARWFMKSDQFTTSCHRVVTALSKSTICYKALNEHSAVLKTRLWNSAGGLVFVWSVGGGRWGITRKGSNERSTHS